ncbi:PQQ-dependent sugar dehydrogenase [Rhizomonospora bruguierae]|uniref:PQQ-dependent sugar dehydrogenase n=1 Tax=Rhizomonospora bruguierae TaxID=1581705 RepID=UPI0020C09E8D|nr:PQQ-dependent sugar dehydrogenase [Micromonospora sp. NBRC 107566]
MRRRLIAVAAAGAVVLAGTLARTAIAAGDVTIQAGGFDLTRPEVVATGLEVPWGMAFLPDGSALVAERMRARIMRVRPGTAPTQAASVPNVSPTGEGGLLGIALSPTYAQDGWVYAYFTAASDNRIVRFQLSSPQNQQVILSGIPRGSIHDGGRIAFGPDGMLYAGVGEAGQTANAQNLNSLGGKILRMRPDGSVPPDNPFAGSLVYSYGHRNVQGLAWDAQGRLWATEFGQSTWDEINLIVAGGNYGWPTVEGRANNPNFRDPLVVWSTSESSPSGAAIANGTLFAAALAGRRLWLVPLNGTAVGTPTAELQGAYGRLRTVMVGPDGYLWVATSNRDGRGTPTADDDRILRFPPMGGGTPTASPTVTPTTPPTTTPPTTNPPGACSVRYVVNQWSNGFTADITVTNGGPALNGWALTWTWPGDQRVTNAWNTELSQSGRAVTARNAAWNAGLPANGTVTLGFQATYSGTNTRPSDFRLGTAACSVS